MITILSAVRLFLVCLANHTLTDRRVENITRLDVFGVPPPANTGITRWRYLPITRPAPCSCSPPSPTKSGHERSCCMGLVDQMRFSAAANGSRDQRKAARTKFAHTKRASAIRVVRLAHGCGGGR